MSDNTSIWATFKDSFNIGCRVVRWDEDKGLNFIPNGKYHKRDLSIENLQPLMKQFAIHWSVTYRASHMFGGLNARGLSCNFMIDDDDNNGYATIYQCLPIMYGGWSQGNGLNHLGPGVEISYMPQAWEKSMYTPALRKRWNVPNHETVEARVHGAKLKVYLPTEAQINSLIQLIWGFCELFPSFTPKFPKTPQGFPVTTILSKPAEFSGLLSHYHLSRHKIDTAGLNEQMVEEEVKKRLTLGY